MCVKMLNLRLASRKNNGNEIAIIVIIFDEMSQTIDTNYYSTIILN